MQQPSLARIITAVELNPDRPRVTLRRDDVRELLADHQRQALTPSITRTGAIRLLKRCAPIAAPPSERLTRERDGLRELAEQRRAAAAPLIHPLAHLPARLGAVPRMHRRWSDGRSWLGCRRLAHHLRNLCHAFLNFEFRTA